MVMSRIALILVAVGIAIPYFVTNLIVFLVCSAAVLAGSILGVIERKKGPRSPLAMIAIVLGFGYLALNIMLLAYLSIVL